METKYIVLLLLLFTLSGCMPVADSSIPQGDAGFLLGLWHGMILLFSFIGSLFNDSIAVYEIANNGGWYDFGFLLGVGGSVGGASR